MNHLDLYLDDTTNKEIVIVGGGAVGLDVAEYFANRGASPTIIEMMNQIGRDLDPVTKSQTKEMMEKHHVKQMTQTKLKELHESYFIVEKENVIAECMVQNIGERTGTEVVQFYTGFRHSGQDRPVKSLCGFRRVTLEPAEKKKVRIICPVRELAWYNPQTKGWQVEQMVYEGYIGNSSSERDLLRGNFKIDW